MITSVSMPAPIAASTPTAPPAAPPSDELPADQVRVDFTRIETPQKVVQLPVMDPAFQLTLALGFVSAALLGGFSGIVPRVGVDVVSQSGGIEIRSHHDIDIGNASQPIRGDGTVGDQCCRSSVALQESTGSLTWSETIGASGADLQVAVSGDQQILQVRGNVGEVPAQLQVEPLTGTGDELIGFHTTGQLGGRPYTLDTLIRGADGSTSPQAGSGKLLVRGHADGSTIVKDYDFSIEEREDGLSAMLHGGGMNAGVPQAVRIKLDITLPAGQA
ncbi:MAG: hypothetical protein HY319_06360 [Armatimonadetes bacterium]|nr:hypothetical protein [Armatimonadota bacterium]